MKYIFLNNIFLILITGLVWAAPDKPFYKQDESANAFVFEKGDEFRFFHFNMIASGSGASFDRNEKTGKWPCLRLKDESDSTDCFIWENSPLWVKPCTQYELSYRYLIDSLKSPEPYIEIVNYDYNTDIKNQERYDIDCSVPQKQWGNGKCIIKTDYYTYEIKLFLRSTQQGTCNIIFDEVYLKQVSEPGVLKPPTNVLNEIKRLEIKDVAVKELCSKTISLPPEKKIFSLSTNVKWYKYDGVSWIYIDWLDEDRRVVGTDFCNVYSIRGIQPKWSGLASRWKQDRSQSSDKCSLKLDWHFNQAPSGGHSQIKRVVEKPSKAFNARIRFFQEEQCSGIIRLERIKFCSEY